MEVTVDLRAVYTPSLFPEGDRPGGTAEAELLSVIEFKLPADKIPWEYAMTVDVSTGFDGSTSVIVENVTASSTLLSITEDVPFTQTYLAGTAGDLIRITSDISGGGTAPASATFTREYETQMRMVFTVPEPATALLICVGSFLLIPRKLRRNKPNAQPAT